MSTCRSLCHSFNFENMRLAVDVILFFLLNSTERFTFMERLFQNFIISFFTLTYVSLDEKFLFTKNNFIPESYSSAH